MRHRYGRTAAKSAVLALAVGSVAGLGGATLALAADAPSAADQIVDYRQSMYTVMAGNFAPIGAMAAGKAPFDAKEAQKRAARVAYISNMLGEGFPPGSDKGNGTHAKPEIWAKRADFDKLMKDLQTQTANLVTAANSGDEAKFKAAAAAVGKACKTCHDKYKTED
ncbi:MAG TPA: cytochrome c [Steroidobacteraceae bacterium]|nr:cytochrome c [Steroidobacteraceae bacterium]